MHDEDLKESVRLWAREVGDHAAQSDEASESITPVSLGDTTLDVQLRRDGASLLIEHVLEVEAAEVEPPVRSDASAMGGGVFEESFDRLIEARPALVRGEATRTDETFRIRVFSIVATDELTRHVFANACEELARTKHAIVRLVSDLGRQRDLLADLESSLSASATAPDDRQPDEVETPALAVDALQGWSPTHVVPASGIAWWTAPDPSVPPTDSLQEGLELQVAERLGDWARVVASNGWSGWVDARLLVEIATGPAG